MFKEILFWGIAAIALTALVAWLLIINPHNADGWYNPSPTPTVTPCPTNTPNPSSSPESSPSATPQDSTPSATSTEEHHDTTHYDGVGNERPAPLVDSNSCTVRDCSIHPVVPLAPPATGRAE